MPIVLYGRVTWSLTVGRQRRLRVVENSLLTRIFGPERDQIIRNWRKLHRKELFIRVIKSRKIKMAEHVPYVEEKCIQNFGGETKEGDHLKDPGVDGRKIIRWIFRTWNGGN